MVADAGAREVDDRVHAVQRAAGGERVADVAAHQLDLGLWLESDRMGFFLPALTQENLDTQRDVVMNERRQRIENQPYGLAGERLHELLYPADHPYHWPVIGYMDDIAAATLEDVQAFFRTYYTPSNAVLPGNPWSGD